MITPSGSLVTRFDRAVDGAFARLRGRPRVDRTMYLLSELGDFSLIWHTISVALALVGGEEAGRRSFRLTAALGAESVLVNVGIKSLMRRPRPEVVADRPHRLRQPRTSSFPSGHASAAACAAVLLADHDRPVQTVAVASLATLVAVSRIHVQIHHASDVVGGAIVGGLLGRAVRHRWPLR